jgi:hypothetical protein
MEHNLETIAHIVQLISSTHNTNAKTVAKLAHNAHLHSDTAQNA